jgi:hypothetical protein
MLSYDHSDHITSNTITAIQVLDYATSILDYLIVVAINRHTGASQWSSLQLDIKPITRHETYNSTRRPTTRHEDYNSARRPTTRHKGLQLGTTTRHKGLQLGTKAYNSIQSLQLSTKAYKILLFEFCHQLPLTERILEPCFHLLHAPMHFAKCHETLLHPDHRLPLKFDSLRVLSSLAVLW